MAHSYPIWTKVIACNYKSNKSYGNYNNATNEIYVGTSAKNSYLHCNIKTIKTIINDSIYGECYEFKTYIDNIIVKKTLVSIKTKALLLQQTYKINE